ncbi:Ribosomal RNA large subunit methyltransferase E [Trinorchestia longiramus]|nr:Ribosomal RNA large subunit methyltransferase E [Trinorchestia longiramus]
MSSPSVIVLRTAHQCCCSVSGRQRLHSALQPIITDVQQRHVHVSVVQHKIVPKNLGGRSRTAQDWLTRQLNDPYVHKAHRLNYRARSAFKLLELQERHALLRPGAVVLECGSSPGAWTQVAVQHCNPSDAPKFNPQLPVGVVVGVDLQPVTLVPGSTLICGDFTLLDTQKKLLKILHPHKPDVVLSDMAPSATGTKDMDHVRIMKLAYTVAHFAKQHAAPGSSLVCKVWGGRLLDRFTEQLTHLYQRVKVTKPPCSRTNSAEAFVVATELIAQQCKTQTALHEKHEDADENEAVAEENDKDTVQQPTLEK